MADIRLGFAPLGWTHDDISDCGKKNTFEQYISAMALAGFDGCEVEGNFSRDISTLKKALSLRNLSVASASFSAYLTTNQYEEEAAAFIQHRDFLHDLGAKVIVVVEQGNSVQRQLNTPVFAGKPHNTEVQWEKILIGLNMLGDLALEKGMKLVYHHNMGTGIQTEAKIDELMENTDPNKVFLLYDTGHLVCSGENYIRILRKYLHRIKHIHLKDIRQKVRERVIRENMSFSYGVRAGLFTAPGDGDVDFKPVFKMLKNSNYQGWCIVEAEQDSIMARKYATMCKNFHNNLLIR